MLLWMLSSEWTYMWIIREYMWITREYLSMLFALSGNITVLYSDYTLFPTAVVP